MEEFFKLEFKPPFDIKIPEIRLPVRKDDCPAAPVCESIGGLRRSCLKGGPGVTLQNMDKCIPSLILLISRIVGQWPPEMIDAVEADRKTIGFELGYRGD